MDRLLVFSDDWGRHPSSCQHLIAHLLPDVDVTWVNTIGMRPPRLDLITARRGLEKVAGWTRREKRAASAERPDSPRPGRNPENPSLAARPRVIDAKMWPWMSHSWDRWLNQKLLHKQLYESAEQAIGITTIPIVADLIGKLPVHRWVYYCVDDFSVWPGLDHRAMGQMERQLIEKADRFVAVSEPLRSHILNVRQQCSLLTHGVDLGHWRCDAPVNWDVHGIEPPVYLFWGVLDRRMDTPFLAALNRRMGKGTILLVGPQQNADPTITTLDRVRLLGAVDFDALPALAAAADVLIMPYIDAAVTRAMQPLKMKEYLATGKPVVARRLPALQEWHDCAILVDDESQFAEAVIERGEQGTDAERLASRRRLADESWASKATILRKILFDK